MTERTTATTLDQLVERTGNIDPFYEATGAAGVAFGALGVNGVFVFTGVPGGFKSVVSFAEVD